jgi:hypothetical protein
MRRFDNSFSCGLIVFLLAVRVLHPVSVELIKFNDGAKVVCVQVQCGDGCFSCLVCVVVSAILLAIAF